MQHRFGAVLAAALASLPLAATPASAQLAVCVLSPLTSGELSLGADLMSWRTTRAGVVQAVNVLPAQLFVQAPTGWTLSPGGSPPTTFSVSAQMTGANLGQLLPNGGVVSGLLSILGTTNATISVGAMASQPFRAGLYSTSVTVTCAAS